MNLLRHLFVTIGMSLLAVAAAASPSEPVNGAEYITLATPQNTGSDKKIEVTEFFAYFCPHCSKFDPALGDWVKKNAERIVFKRVHIAIGAAGSSILQASTSQQRLYYTLESMGNLEAMHGKVFHAIHAEHLPLANDAAVIDFITRQGIDRKKFVDLFNSFAVQTKMQHALQMQATYKIASVPTIAIDGKYITSPGQVASGMPRTQTEAQVLAATAQVLDALVAKSGKEHVVAAKAGKAVKP